MLESSLNTPWDAAARRTFYILLIIRFISVQTLTINNQWGHNLSANGCQSIILTDYLSASLSSAWSSSQRLPRLLKFGAWGRRRAPADGLSKCYLSTVNDTLRRRTSGANNQKDLSFIICFIFFTAHLYYSWSRFTTFLSVRLDLAQTPYSTAIPLVI